MHKLIVSLLVIFLISIRGYALEVVFPEKITIKKKGDTVSFPVQIKDLNQNITGVEVRLEYDGAVLKFQEVTIGSFLTSTGLTVDLLGPIVDNNSLKFAVVLRGDKEYPKGEGVLANLTFQGLQTGSSNLTVKKVIFVDDNLPVNELAVNVITSGEVSSKGSSSGGGCSFSLKQTDYTILLVLILTVVGFLLRKRKVSYV